MSKSGPIIHFFSPLSCDSLVLQGFRCEWGAGVFNWYYRSHSLILVTGSSTMAPHGKDYLRIWKKKKKNVSIHKDGVGFKKITKTLKLSCQHIARPYKRFNRTGSTSEQASQWSTKRSWVHVLQRHIQRLCLGNRRMSAASIAVEVEGMGGQPVCANNLSINVGKTKEVVMDFRKNSVDNPPLTIDCGESQHH